MTPEGWRTQGEPPTERRLLRQVSIDPAHMIAFLREHYAQRFIPQGGSKVKWIIGPPGSGKTHALRMLELAAAEDGLLTVALDAGATPLRGIQEFGQAVLAQLDTTQVLRGLRDRVIRRLGYDTTSIPPSTTLVDWLVAERGRIRDTAMADIREHVDQMLAPVDVGLSLKVAVSFKVGELLGVPSPDTDTLDAWLTGAPLREPLMKRLGLTEALNRQNARTILQGWAVLARTAGRGGILITVDQLDQLVAPKGDGTTVYYTAGRREETYEMLREFIDDGDVLPGLWLVLAARPALYQDEKRGISSYPALKDRVSTELTSVELNRFSDWLDWDSVFAADEGAMRRVADAWAVATGGRPHVAPAAGSMSQVRRTMLASVGGPAPHHDAWTPLADREDPLGSEGGPNPRDETADRTGEGGSHLGH